MPYFPINGLYCIIKVDRGKGHERPQELSKELQKCLTMYGCILSPSPTTLTLIGFPNVSVFFSEIIQDVTVAPLPPAASFTEFINCFFHKSKLSRSIFQSFLLKLFKRIHVPNAIHKFKKIFLYFSSFDYLPPPPPPKKKLKKKNTNISTLLISD